MAEARKCDRCNEFYELSKEDQSRRDWPADTKGAVARLFLRTSTDDRGEWYDLCPNCVELLNKWLKNPDNYDPQDLVKNMAEETIEYEDPCESCCTRHCEQCVYGYCSEEEKKKRWLERNV